MHSPVCDIPVHVEPQLVIAAMVYAIIFATTACGLAIWAYVHAFGRLGPSAAISLANVLVWYILNAAFWVVPLAHGIRVYLRALDVGGQVLSESFAGSVDDIDIASTPAPALMCATPGVLAISILVGEGVLWWRVCAVWAGNRAVKSICALSLVVTVVFAGVTFGRLQIVKAPPTRLAVMFFVEPDGVGTALSVSVSNVVAAVLLGSKIRKQRRPCPRSIKGSRIIHRLKEPALWSVVAGTLAGASWVAATAFRREVWTTFRDDTPTWSFWNFTLFAATASCIRVPALAWWLPRSFACTFASADDDDGRAPSDDPRRSLDPRRRGAASYARQLVL